MRKRYIIKIRIFLWLILANVVGWLLYMGIVPSGKISYVYDFTKPNYFIGKLTPKERVEEVKDRQQKIIGDPVYFSLHTLRRFDRAKLTLKYKEVSGITLPIIESGVLVDKIIWRHDLKPLENRIISQLALIWDVIQEDRVILLQREKTFANINEFLTNLPEKNEIALYNYELKDDYTIEGYEPKELSSEYSELSSFYSLRGPYQFYTYIKTEDLDFTFNFVDVNKNRDKDQIDLHLYYDNELIDSYHLDDDGNLSDDGKTSDRGEVKMKLANLPEGVYKIEIRANDDIITKKIITKQSKLSFINKIWISDTDDQGISLYSDSLSLQAQTINPASLQTIKAGDKELVIDETYKLFSIVVSSGIKEIKLVHDDIILSGDGVFSFGQDALINPRLRKVTANLDINKEGINYVLARYVIPESKGEWKIAQAEFDLTKAYREKGQHGFLISIPGLRADDEIDDSIEVDEIKVELEGKGLLEKLKGFY